MTTLNNDELNAIELAKKSPGRLAIYISNGKWFYAPHLELLDLLLVKAANRKINRLIINMPPRHGKSELISKYFPAWYLGNFPERNIILTSYEARFATSWGRKVRDIIKEHGKNIFDIEINPASKSSQSFEILGSGGGMNCAGARGPITGKGADLLIIDDPIKNDAEANSPLIRDRVWEWFNSTAYTRLEPEGIIVIIMTRWHEDDLCGRLMNSRSNIFFEFDESCKENPKPISSESIILPNKNSIILPSSISGWNIIKLPALAEEEDLLGRQYSEPLWKKRFNLKRLTEIKRAIGSYWFSALYQQNPTPAGGGIFKRKYFKYFSVDEEFYYLYESESSSEKRKVVKKSDCSFFAAMDLATTTKQTSDYTVVLIFALTLKKDILILEIYRERFEGADHLNLLQSVFERWAPTIIGIENTQYQISLIQSALRAGLPIKPLKADKDKVTRALPAVARLEAGSIYFREKSPWLDCFEDELLAFPNAKHDDQVDAFAYISVLIQPITKANPASAAINRVSGRSITKGF